MMDMIILGTGIHSMEMAEIIERINTALTSGVTLAGSVVVGNGCYMGQNCTVRQFLHIGECSTVGMGAVVVRDVPPNAVMAGNPARVLRMKE